MKPFIFPLKTRLGILTVAATAVALLAVPAATSLRAQHGGSALPDQPDDATIAHVLNRIGFGPRPGDIERVKQMGLAKYVDEQLNPLKINDGDTDQRLASFTTLTMSSRDLADKIFLPATELRKQEQAKQAKTAPPAASTDPSMTTPSAPKAPPPVPPEVKAAQAAQQSVMNDLMQAKILRAAISNRQLEEVLDDFWFNHFNVYVQKGEVRQYLTSYERDVIRPHVLGSFRDLLGAVAHSPAMLFYLDNWESSTPNGPPALTPEMQRRLSDPWLPPMQRQQILARLQQAKNNNQARGLNENYAREIMELHTLGVDGGYTQKDVQELARVLTGWTIDQPRLGGSFVFRPQMHDFGEKTILGQDFPANHGEDEGERALDVLAVHQSTAHHIAFELAQRFVADDPPATLVDRTASVFLETKGDLKEVVRTIVTSPEFFAPDAYRAKVKTPLEFVVSAVRAADATIGNAQPIIGELRQQLGMPLYGCQPPTGYSMTADAWVNTGSLLNRMNFALQLVSGPGSFAPGRPGGPGRAGGAGARVLGNGPGPALAVNVFALAPDTSDAARQHLIDTMLAGRVSDATRATLARATTPQQLVALALGSPEFQKR